MDRRPIRIEHKDKNEKKRERNQKWEYEIPKRKLFPELIYKTSVGCTFQGELFKFNLFRYENKTPF